MKVVLLELENHFSTPILEEAMDLVKETNEYDLTQPEAGYFHCVSKSPDFHVELQVSTDGMVSAKCHCAVFTRTKVCKHAVGGMMILRDHKIRKRRVRSKSKHEKLLLDDVLKKLNITELRKFISEYAQSHSAFRAEVLANYLHLIRKPDYHHLLMDMTPMDKFGIIKLNRNNLKSVRNIVAILLKQAQQLLKENILPQTFLILEATIHHLYRLVIKVPQFQEQLTTELRHALRLFEVYCHAPMAPRLQKSAITLAIDVSTREGFILIKGTNTLLRSVEPFILEKKSRRAAFQLVEGKITLENPQRVLWACILLRWTRIWSVSTKKKEVKDILKSSIPDIILELQAQREYEDLLYVLGSAKMESYPQGTGQMMLQAGLRAAKLTGDDIAGHTLAYQLSVIHHDTEAWESLYLLDAESAIKALHLVQEYYTAGDNDRADLFLLNGFKVSGQKKLLLEQLKAIGDIQLLMDFDSPLTAKYPNELVTLYAQRITALREKYGGETVRRKLNIINNHLKDIDLHSLVVETLKNMEQKRSTDITGSGEIRGFIFDLDGVIVDTAEHHFHSWKAIMKELGATISEEDDRQTRGASRMESLEYLVTKYNIRLTPEEKVLWAAKKNDLYLEAIKEITPRDLLPGVLAFLIDSKKAGLSIALGSASKNAKTVLNKLGIENRFDVILDGTDTKKSKPDPEIFIKGCKAIQLHPSEVVVFEDAAKGVKAAMSAGCKVVGIGDADVLHEADFTITGLDQSTPLLIIEKLK